MGYGSTAKFVEYLDIFQKQGVPQPASILTLGDQTVNLADKDGLKYVQRFIDHYATYDTSKYERLIGQRIHVRQVYEDAGFDFVSLDLNQIDGSIPLDLNLWPNDQLPTRQFDVVTNEGTTEHVANQMNAFAIIHYLTRPGGIMIHEIPILHFGAHAMVTTTPLFLKKLIDANGYEIIQARLMVHDVAEAKAFHHGPWLEFLERFTDLMERSTLAAMAYLVLKRPDDAAFVPPLDVALDSREGQGILDGYVERYRGPATATQIALAKQRIRSTSRTVTERIAAAVPDTIKTFDGSRHAQHLGLNTPPLRTTDAPPHAGEIRNVTVALQLPFSPRKAFIAASALLAGVLALAVIVLVIVALLLR